MAGWKMDRKISVILPDIISLQENIGDLPASYGRWNQRGMQMDWSIRTIENHPILSYPFLSYVEVALWSTEK